MDDCRIRCGGQIQARLDTLFASVGTRRFAFRRHQRVIVLALECLLDAAPELAFLPAVEYVNAGDHTDADRHQSCLQIAHHPACYAASSASFIASSMSTATTRDTPASCIVTPMSCSAISIAILLCEMNRNCVPLYDISATSFA